jgi:hypothetical protein
MEVSRYSNKRLEARPELYAAYESSRAVAAGDLASARGISRTGRRTDPSELAVTSLRAS